MINPSHLSDSTDGFLVTPWTIDRVVVRSRAQIVKPDAVFVVFLGIKWAHDIVEKNRS